PVTGKETRVEVPLVPGTDGNLSGTSPYTATIPGTNTVSTTPATTGKTLKDVLKELKPGDITGIQVAGKKEGITLPTADAIKAASNTNTGHKNDNSSGKSSAISAVILTPDGSALPKDSGLVITATLGSDDYTQSTVANAVNCPYEFVGVKVDGKVLELGKDYTVDLTTQPGKAIVTFTKAQLDKIAPDQDLGAIELLTKPTNPQYKTFVDDYQKLNDLFDRYKKPDATAKDKAVFEELVSKLNNQLTTTDAGVLAKTEQLTEDNKANLVSQQAQLQAYDSAITAKKAASDVSTAIDAMYRQLEQDVKAAGGTLPVGDTVTGSLAAAILKNKSAIDGVTKAYNALTGAQKAQVNTDQNTKRTTAANALAAAEKGTKTPGEIARELIGKLPNPTNVLKDPTKPADGLKDKTSGGDGTNDKYGINDQEATDGTHNAAALTELEQLHQDLLAAEKAAKQPGAALTVPEAKKLSDLRAAVETEYEDYAKRFAKDHLTDKDGTLGSPAVPTDGTYPSDKITDWVKYPSELTALKKKYDQLPAKVQQEIDKVMAPDYIGDIFKEVFPDVNDLDAVGTATILDELDTDPGAGKVYVKLADLDSATAVGGSGKTGKEWVESIVKTYEKYRDIPEAEKENVNKALAPETMENLYNKAKDQSSNSAESQKAANDFIKKHLTDGGKTILAATDGNKGKITGGEGDWANLSFGAQKAINDKLTALGGKSYPALVADAKALDSGSSGGGSGSSGSGSGGGSSRPITVTVDPGKDGGGKVTLSPKNPKPGEEVTITVTPEPGFQIDTVLITDKNGKELPKLGSNPFTIIAPADGFTVKSTFKKADKVDGQVGPFADVSDKAWYAPAVDFVYMEGLFKGISETQFGPAVTMNRGMFITVLGRLAKVDTDKWSATGKFPDVASDAYYAPYVAWGAAEGIVLGYDNGNYGPEDLVTREQMAAILYRYVQKQGGGYQGNWVFLLPYADAASVSDWALEGISWCSQHKVVQGKENNRLDPTGDASRAEVAQLMMNYCNLKPAN
ncbi:MAG: S-layer homology domain-containing protein, partial [Oscillospiraceae bacterium]